jgi:hypothetical protein
MAAIVPKLEDRARVTGQTIVWTQEGIRMALPGCLPNLLPYHNFGQKDDPRPKQLFKKCWALFWRGQPIAAARAGPSVCVFRSRNDEFKKGKRRFPRKSLNVLLVIF